MDEVQWASPNGPEVSHPDWRPPGDEDVRQELRSIVRRSTYAMAKGVIGYKDLTKNTHKPFCDFIDSPAERKYALAPRDHLKTSIFTIADIVRRIADNPNIRILIGNETATNASKMLTRVESVFERNALFQWLFPEVIPDFSKVKRWSSTEMLVPRGADFVESTLEAIGVDGAVVSRHYDVIKLDDLVGKAASESRDVMEKTIAWYQYCESLLDHPVHGHIHIYGTRWSHWDVYSWVEENEPYVTRFFRSAIRPDGTALWPERFPLEVLERLRLKMGSYKFSCQYLNDPKDEKGRHFLREWLQPYRLDEGYCIPKIGQRVAVKDLRKSLRVDPAIGEKDNNCRTAIVVDGVAADGRKFLLDVWAKRCSPLEMIDKIFQLYDKWDCDSVGVEAVCYQRAVKPFLEKECYERNRWIVVHDLKPDKNESKISRIMGMQPYCERGEIYVEDTQTEFLEEYARFPHGKTVDIMDAWGYGPRMWEVPDLPEEGMAEDEEWMQESLFTGRMTSTGY